MKGQWSTNPVTTYKNMTSPLFWERAKPSKIVGPKPAWMNFDDQWVDEVKRGLKACGVFCWFPLYCTPPSLICRHHSLMRTRRVNVQPVEQQLDFAGSYHGDERLAKRRLVELGSFRVDYFHSPLRSCGKLLISC